MLLEDVVLALQCQKCNSVFLAYVPILFQKGNTEPLTVFTYQALKKRRILRTNSLKKSPT